ncbi:triose-phosphate isomerase [Haliscomenobacter hydrossis]|uniref:Triosephosphate isomerase n=1 Tax=Haliscomenobacter hydrossis (strain ATCC 27775 / DSM 1100 / LMG 10767 / O) TaxID=760192 RepID=F4L605_HALH1|nr:triose-phosphate isomerase [Haliscomenobacter hydrossis]AEE53065.1 triosephosphate isomerase [Haliscomenobacter hydrossis DSM 1100]
MKTRQQIVAGNWKMNKNYGEGRELAMEIVERLKPSNTQVVLCAPYIHLQLVKNIIKDVASLYLGAQNCHQEDKGAYTGEISVDMLKSVGVSYVILGHSERREYFGESDELLAKKTDKVLAAGLLPIFCCGESLDIRDAGTHVAHVQAQIKAGLFHLSPEEFQKVVIAYEPIWAIGTGRTASPEQAQDMHAAIRALLTDQYGAEIADATTILYGGSVNGGNAAVLFSQPDVDGGLVGGASLKAEEFITIVEATKK